MPRHRPFWRQPFETLPERPRVPHPFFEAPSRTIAVTTPGFGPVDVHVRIHGSGPPLLLVHGLMTSSYSWRYVLEPLGERFTLYVPDLPGCGRTPARPERTHSASALGELVGAIQHALGIEGSACVGNSLGGYVCMHRALAAPDSFSRLVVVHAPGVPEVRLSALHALLRAPGAASLLTRLVHRDVERWAHANVHYFDETLKSREEAREYGHPLKSDEGARALFRYLHDALAPAEIAAFGDVLARRRDRGEGFPMPLRLLYARRDPMVPPRVGARLHALVPDAEFSWLEQSSHFAHVDSPARVVAMLRDFLG